ncbi:MAG: hypothetical protein AAF410_05540, partial [Pseudomonadota bacterium]
LGIKQTNQSDLSSVQDNSVADQDVNTINSLPTQSFEFNQSPQYRQAAVQSDTPATAADNRMSGYLINHNEYRKGSGVTAIRPYVRIVTIQADE